jgi:hypothetical protein
MEDDDVTYSMWISFLVLGSLTFLGTSGFYIRKRLINSREVPAQTAEFATNAIELSPVSDRVNQNFLGQVITETNENRVLGQVISVRREV